MALADLQKYNYDDLHFYRNKLIYKNEIFCFNVHSTNFISRDCKKYYLSQSNLEFKNS